MEKWNGTHLVVTGDSITNKESVLGISNHPSEADWLWWPGLAVRKGILSQMRVVVKDTLRKLPCAGWAIDAFNWLFLSRNWDIDKKQIVWTCKAYVDDEYPVQMFIYPEGTDYTPAKAAKSTEFAQKNGLPVFKYVLTPRVKGFLTVAQTLRPSIDAVYDITVAYPNGIKPSAWCAISGHFPKTVFIHIRRYPINEVPKGDEALEAWCYKLFHEKDELLEYFEKNGKFPSSKNKDDGALGDVPLSVYFWFAFWVIYTFGMMYLCFTYWPVLVFQLIGMCFNIVNAVYDPCRIMVGYAPPASFLSDKDKSKKN